MSVRQASLIAGVFAYPVLIRVALLHGGPGLAGLLSLACWSLLGAMIVHRQAAWLAAILISGAALASYQLGWQTDMLIFVPPVVLNMLVAYWFLASLRPGREPVIMRFARITRGELEPAMRIYTRRVTWLWGLSCLGLALASLVLAWLAPLSWWLLFSNGLNYLLILLLFAGENLYRRWRFRHVAHVSPLRMWQLVRAEMTRTKAGIDG